MTEYELRDSGQCEICTEIRPLVRTNTFTHHKTICEECRDKRSKKATPKMLKVLLPPSDPEWMRMSKESQSRIERKWCR